MPRNQFQRMVFAFITVVITIHAYVFYSLYVIHGNMFMQITGESGVLAAINKMGGFPVCILYSTFLYSAFGKNHIQNSFCKGYQKPQKSRRKRENNQLIFK